MISSKNMPDEATRAPLANEQDRFILSRRVLMATGAGAAATASLSTAQAANVNTTSIENTLKKYYSFGYKASGGVGDNACGVWMEDELRGMGYTVARQALDVPAFEGPPASLLCNGQSADLVPQAAVVPTSREGIAAPLYIGGADPVTGGIVMIVLPYARRATVVGEVERLISAEFSRGAAAAILVTNGPTKEACALNTPVDGPLFEKPVAIIAPKDADRFVAAALRRQQGVLRMPGRSFRREAFNVIANLDRGKTKTLIISTPRSGWFDCMAERGPGVAAWMEIARWASRAPLSVNVALVATTAHEYEQAGGEEYIQKMAPPPSRTALWLHLGANLASPDWHELRGELLKLDATDPQRILVASPDLIASARKAFKGQAGLENAYEADVTRAGGEMLYVLKAGYTSVLGVAGNNRHFHTKADDLRNYAPELIPPVVNTFQNILSERFLVSGK